MHDIIKKVLEGKKKTRERFDKIVEKYAHKDEDWFDTIMRIVEEYDFDKKGDKYVR